METQKTFYQKWEDNEPGFTNQGSFCTQLMLLYRVADNGNRAKLEMAFPEYFLTPKQFIEKVNY